MNSFLIPANSKKSQLIFSVFRPFDLALFLSGVGVTTILLLIVPLEGLLATTLVLAPALICGFLVFPVPNYHNILTVILNIYEFYTTRQRFIWKGWCVLNGTEEEQK